MYDQVQEIKWSCSFRGPVMQRSGWCGLEKRRESGDVPGSMYNGSGWKQIGERSVDGFEVV